MSTEETPSESHRLVADRRAGVHEMQAEGIDVYGQRFDTTGNVGEVRARFAEGQVFRVAGRVTAHRDMGKSHFLELGDLTGHIQIYFNRKNFTEPQDRLFRSVHTGDFLGIEGEGFVTRHG